MIPAHGRARNVVSRWQSQRAGHGKPGMAWRARDVIRTISGVERTAMGKGVQSAFDDLIGVVSQLGVDATLAQVRAIGSVDQYDRRTYVRTFFAFVEGTTFCEQKLAEHDPGLTEGQRERAHTSGKAARASAQRSGERSKPCLDLLSAFAAVTAAHGIPNPIDTASPSWQAFRDAVLVRNRVTHPRTAAECSVSEDDITVIRSVHGWYQEKLTGLWEAIGAAREIP
ncbi:MAG: hypothetical protein IT193_20265 [Propionibacteriaceae bacterium]|nr:hypothetical protein [Propionibacteriaceae bacterium]